MFDLIKLELKPSFFLSTIIALPCLSAIVIVGTRDAPTISILLVSLILLGISFYYVNLFGLLGSKKSIKHISLSKQVLKVYGLNKKPIIVNLLNSSFISPWLCILQFTSTDNSSNRYTVILCRQNIKSQSEFRRLRVWSKYGISPSEVEIL